VNDRTREALRYSLTVFVAVRLVLFVAGMVAAGLIHPIDPVSVPGWHAPLVAGGDWRVVFTAWERFDALWFLRIADAGYRMTDGSAAFYPLFPLLVRVVSFALGGHPFAAGMLVSNASFAAALCVLYLLTAEERSVETARTAVLLTAVFPSALFFYAPYSESLFLLLVLVCFRAARRRAWWMAAAAAVLAALTRIVGIALAPALAIEAIQQWREGHRSSLVRGLVAAAAPGVGTAAYLWYWYAKIGDALAPIHFQVNWLRTPSWPWVTFAKATEDLVRYVGTENGGYWAIDWLIVVPVVAASIWAIRRYRPSYVVYMWSGLLIPLSYVFEPRPLMSMPRFVLPLFPVFWAISELTHRWRIPRAAVAAAAAGGLGLLTVLFVNWYYIF
jgi:Gpi18-like mannosyltransferase